MPRGARRSAGAALDAVGRALARRLLRE